MYTLFNPGKLSDKNVFHYTHAAFMQSRIYEYLTRYQQLRKQVAGRVQSNHLLINILTGMNVEFNGNLIEFLGRADQTGTNLSRTLGLTSNYNTGRLFNSVLYPGCKEIIIQNRNTDYMWFDLWNNWRSVSAIKVLSHPVTDLTVFELGVMNPAQLSKPDLCVWSVDVAVLYTQWHFYRASQSNPSLEGFLTEIVYPNAFQSHLNLVMFNRLLAKRELVEFCTVKDNLPFNQQSVTPDLDKILTTVEKNISGRRLRPNQYLAAIPTITGEDFLNETYSPDLMPTSQAMWAILASKCKQARFLLDIGKESDYVTMSDMLVRLKRTVIEVNQQNLFGTGLSQDASKEVRELFDRSVVQHIP